MGWCISSPRSWYLSQRINIWKLGRQNDWVQLKVQKATWWEGWCWLGLPVSTSIWNFFVLSMVCISFLSLRKTYDVSHWSDCFLKQCSWFSQFIKGERLDWSCGLYVSVRMAACQTEAQMSWNLRYQDNMRNRYSSGQNLSESL